MSVIGLIKNFATFRDFGKFQKMTKIFSQPIRSKVSRHHTGCLDPHLSVKLIVNAISGLRKHDVCFLISVVANMTLQQQFDWSKPFVSQVGLTCVRGCEIEGMLDEHGRVIEEGPEPKPQLTGSSRTYRVWLDTNQYQQDMASIVQGGEVRGCG